MNLYKFPEKRRVREIKISSNFFNAHLRMFQLVFDLLNSIFLNDLHGSFSRCLFDDGAKMLGTVAKFVGIITDRTVGTIVGIDQVDKISYNKATSAMVDAFSIVIRY